MIQVAQPVSTSALIGICTCFVLSVQAINEKTEAHVALVMNSILFAYFPIGCRQNDAPTRRDELRIPPRADFMIPLLIGAVVMVVKSDGDAWTVAAVAVVTVVILAITVFAWSRLCCYPKVHMDIVWSSFGFM
jgi:hypothetical protein